MPKPQQIMQQALELARRGLGEVEPNPAVGCVIVRNGCILGEGWHRQFGGPHAEINALESCRQNGHDPAGTDVYVTLEPCCVTGKTGPCTEALIRAKPSRVIAALEDPSERISGKGFEQLRKAGIEVEVGLCRMEAEILNAPFFKHTRTGLPWVILKWAQSIDGKLGRRTSFPHDPWISNEKSRQDVHRIRKKVQGVLTGIQTILHDNPRLTVRLEDSPPARPPARIVLDSQLRIPWDCHVITVPDAPTWIVTTAHGIHGESSKAGRLREAGVEILIVPEKNHRCDLKETLRQLGQHGLQQILIEAGPTLLSHFLEEELGDEIRIYIAPLLLGQAGIGDIAAALDGLPQSRFRDPRFEILDDNVLFTARLKKKGL